MTERHDNYSLICFIARGVIGMRFFMVGMWKVFVLTPVGHAEKWFATPAFSESFLPMWSLWLAGTLTPVVEFAAGALLLLGLYTRWAAFALGLVLIEVTFGHELEQPLFEMHRYIFVDFVCLTVVLWSEAHANVVSLDRWLVRRNQQRANPV